ncbi:START domain-containing protein [Endozoicomonas sp. YOMI1]|uniref:START domain-containing protein n=1 Tax=Endozoicomonas sp. YOMI1 TaxID=2828739 RepID=UPI0021490C23|nr:START domain-containing protein [Endozoicomonas sp. YOMI1]
MRSVIPIFVESKGEMYKLKQLPDFVKLRDFAESQDGKWSKVYEDRQKVLLVESRPEDLKPGEKGTGFNIVRATVEWDDINPETLFNTLHDADYRKTWDNKMIEGYEICQLDSRNDIGYYSVQPYWPISKRDFCNMRSWMEFTNGEYIIMNHSVCHADCPEREGFVRARSVLTGYYIIPTPSGGAKLIYISHTDPKGFIPAWLVNNLMGNVIPSIVTNLHDCALKYDTWSLENHGADTKYKWRTPKIDWNDSTKEVKDDA